MFGLFVGAQNNAKMGGTEQATVKGLSAKSLAEREWILERSWINLTGCQRCGQRGHVF